MSLARGGEGIGIRKLILRRINESPGAMIMDIIFLGNTLERTGNLSTPAAGAAEEWDSRGDDL